MKIRPVILSGGSGTRLWPVSRARAPKQFVPLLGDENLFTATLRTVADPASFAAPMIVGNADHRFLIHDALEEAKVTAAAILLESAGRNTAAAVIVAALAETDPDMLHLVRPSDHVIGDADAWRRVVALAVPAAAADLIALFGIAPDHPETGYGYIVPGAATLFSGVRAIATFREKPDAGAATALIRDGALWNSGIFLYRPSVLLAEAERLAPAIVAGARAALATATRDNWGLTLGADAYAATPSAPFDRAIMEKTAAGAVVPCAVGWSDVGSWQALWQAADRDGSGNACTGPVVVHATSNSLVRSEGPSVAVMGMSDIAVIATKDAVMVTPLARTQDVKTMVGLVERASPDLAQEHARARRPWGTHESVARGDRFQVKHITVLPGRSLSLQMHHHRAEHWIVVRGTARVECDGVEKLVFPNESVYIPKGARHRLGNPGTIDLDLIEVQSGDYLGEDDIVRLADDYGRSV